MDCVIRVLWAVAAAAQKITASIELTHFKSIYLSSAKVDANESDGLAAPSVSSADVKLSYFL
jgi:hypothetical protein